MSDFFDIDMNKLVAERIPVRLRMPRVMAFVRSASSELNKEYQAFRTNRLNNLYRLDITPQVCFLEKMLNDAYDFTQRRIYITDGLDRPVTFIFLEVELKPVFIGSKYIYTAGETSQMADDFIIYVPMDISFEEAEMVGKVKAYKLAGTRFKIQRF